MIKPKRLKPGDKVAIVSLSWGGLGDEEFLHKYDIAKKRLEKEFNLEVIVMPHALRGSEFVYNHPELRAKDLMDAFRDNSIAAIFSSIGGDDTIRLIPHIDYEVIRNNPKIFMGYSDTTANHLMMYKAGLTSFYGPSVMCEFGEYVTMFEYTKKAVRDILFGDTEEYKLESSPEWSRDYVPWNRNNIHVGKGLIADEHGYEILQGKGKAVGHLLGGCLDTLVMCYGTEVWPSLDKWTGAVLFIETSEEKPSPHLVKYNLRNLAAQGILKVISGILVGKPQEEVYYEEYKEVIHQVITGEEKLTDLPIVYNVNFGHAYPIGIIPYGIKMEIDCEEKTLTLLESATIL
ncbi:MAG: putative peptidase [Anaerocolumna sp.]|nr:putative peptidase [Anaerocolumna sp.]